MTALDRLAWIAAAASLTVAPACSSGSSPGVAADGSAPQDATASDDEAPDGGDFAAAVMDAAPPTYAPTFTAVYGEILSPICAGPFCHGAGNEFLLMSSKGVAYSATVGVLSHGPSCADSGLTIVKPGDADASLLYLKVTDPPCGNRMPAGYEPYLDSRQTEQVRQWIAMGALDN
ncbi:MAG TPA: hypothetical protein VK762_08565 [Polyangiaceae bacterium]|jgi:hypothetical protein|nr:hypothetical protein [Polyangiaceae bacterium]